VSDATASRLRAAETGTGEEEGEGRALCWTDWRNCCQLGDGSADEEEAGDGKGAESLTCPARRGRCCVSVVPRFGAEQE
jgi:hypothetical protein